MVDLIFRKKILTELKDNSISQKIDSNIQCYFLKIESANFLI